MDKEAPAAFCRGPLCRVFCGVDDGRADKPGPIWQGSKPRQACPATVTPTAPGAHAGSADAVRNVAPINRDDERRSSVP
jgi:hypothetical protein